MALSSVVIYDFNVFNVSVVPCEADSPFVIDSDAMLTLPVTLERFQTVAGGNPQVIEDCGPVQHSQLPKGTPLNVSGEPGRRDTIEEAFRVRVFEAPNHVSMVLRLPQYSKYESRRMSVHTLQA